MEHVAYQAGVNAKFWLERAGGRQGKAAERADNIIYENVNDLAFHKIF